MVFIKDITKFIFNVFLYKEVQMRSLQNGVNARKYCLHFNLMPGWNGANNINTTDNSEM